MYLHIGMDTIINTKNITGIFDLDNATLSYKTRDFLSAAQAQGKIVNVCTDLPKSFILCCENEDFTVYICQLSPATLMKRMTAANGKDW